MPLSFESASHGRIAFGFFNIDSDMLLLEHYFFFADEFCRHLSEAAASNPGENYEAPWNVYHIAKPEDVGDLMGAIHAVRFSGFIGETYKRYPFPKKQEDFKQKPEGHETQAVFREMIEKYAVRTQIPFVADAAKREVSVGEYHFSSEWFHELINYVWVGGMPRYRNEEKPGYVLDMKNSLQQSSYWLFEGLTLQLPDNDC